MYDDPDEGRFEITEAIESLRSLYRESPNALVLKLFFDAKADEISKIYSEAYPNEKTRIFNTLNEIDPSNSSLYQSIMNSNSEVR